MQHPTADLDPRDARCRAAAEQLAALTWRRAEERCRAIDLRDHDGVPLINARAPGVEPFSMVDAARELGLRVTPPDGSGAQPRGTALVLGGAHQGWLIWLDQAA